jgi:hypothetical protein
MDRTPQLVISCVNCMHGMIMWYDNVHNINIELWYFTKVIAVVEGISGTQEQLFLKLYDSFPRLSNNSFEDQRVSLQYVLKFLFCYWQCLASGNEIDRCVCQSYMYHICSYYECLFEVYRNGFMDFYSILTIWLCVSDMWSLESLQAAQKFCWQFIMQVC